LSGKQTVSSYLAPIAVKILKEIETESGSKCPEEVKSFATNKKTSRNFLKLVV
jgi:hypothetical protein